MSNGPTDGWDPTRQGQYPPEGYAPPPQQQEEAGGKKKTGLIIGGVVLVLLLIGVGLALAGMFSSDDEQAGGEVFLAPATEVGEDPFNDDPLAAVPDPTLVTPVSATGASVEAGSAQAATSNGSTPGLYGGTMDKASCDTQKLIDFLTSSPEKAQAWVDTLAADPDVKLSDGSPLTVAKIPEYVASLTSVVLTQDTQVTNHGFKDGKATPLQSVLQKGTAVLVDQNGVPRVKCYCGNPLLPPKGAAKTYTGSTWQDFDPNKVNKVDRSTTVINVFVLTDPKTGKTFERPAGSTGAQDKPTDVVTTTTTAPASTTTVPATTAPATTAPPTTAAPTTAPPTTAPAGPCGPTGPENGTSDMTVTNNTATELQLLYVTPDCNTEYLVMVPAGGSVIRTDIWIGAQFRVLRVGDRWTQDHTANPGDIDWVVNP